MNMENNNNLIIHKTKIKKFYNNKFQKKIVTLIFIKIIIFKILKQNNYSQKKINRNKIIKLKMIT